MYFPYFVAYMVAGFVLSLLVFFWALNNGQFRDQQRARYLPLDEKTGSTPVKLTRLKRVEMWVLFLLAGCGLFATAVAITLTLITTS